MKLKKLSMNKLMIMVLLLSHYGMTQNNTKHLFSLQGDYEICGLDKQGNVYVVSKNTLYKFDNKGKKLFNYADNTKGTITHVGISNPMKITVLYGHIGIITVLDNTLSPIGNDIHVFNLEIYEPTLSCAGSDGGFWVYDIASGKCLSFNWNGQQLFETTNLHFHFLSHFSPNQITMLHNQVVLFAENEKIVTIDNAGNIQETLETQNQTWSAGVCGLHYIQNNMVYQHQTNQISHAGILFDELLPKRFYFCFPYLLAQYEQKISLFLLKSR
jgi:WD40 repeat protein